MSKRRVHIERDSAPSPSIAEENDEELLQHEGDRVGDAGEEEEDSDGRRVRKFRTRRDLERMHFRMVNEKVVSDVTLEVFYKPHTLTILALLCAFLTYKAFTAGSDETTDKNVYDGLIATLTLFLVVSAMAFPNGPFIRPHPIFWRIIFGLSIVYMLVLQLTLFQTYADVKRVLSWLDPTGLAHTKLAEKEYAINCSDVTLERIWSYMDIFAVGHFLGWAMKALLIRHAMLCWYISIAWELTEVVFTHLLPNFQECWWDAIILDVLVCNGLGICFGLKVCDWLTMRQFHWESIKQIKGARGKLRRAVLQFTPESWTRVDWLHPSVVKRTINLYLFVLMWLLSELNTFFLKHVFAVDTNHPVVLYRLFLIAFISAPSIRQYYLYVTDPLVTRLGMQCWVYIAVCALEAAVCVKFGRSQLPSLKLMLVSLWIVVLVVTTFGCVHVSILYARKSSMTREEVIEAEGTQEKRLFYVDSSVENLGIIGDDVRRRRRQLGLVPSESDRD